VNTIDDLQQIFRILPVLAERRSIPIDELMTMGGYTKKANLLADLEKLRMLGIAPYGPGDLFDIEILHNEVVLHSPTTPKPLSLDPQEWSLLHSLLAENHTTSSTDLTEAARISLIENIGAVPVSFIQAGLETEYKSQIEEAISKDRCIDLLYSKPDGAEENRRLIDPWILTQHNRSHYIVGFDHGHREPRMFRLDRIVSLKITNKSRSQKPPENIETVKQSLKKPTTTLIQFKLKPSILTSLQREFAFHIDEQNDDFILAHVETSSVDFFRWYLKAYAPFIEVIQPKELRQWIIDEATDFEIPALLS